MDYEQKHKEDLEAAKGWLAIAKENNNTIAIQILEKFFPELRKSEDEQHRRWILEYLYDGLRKSDEQFKDQFKSAIAWLEKQDEKKPEKTSIWKHWSGNGIAGNGSGELVFLIKNGNTYSLSSCLGYECDYIELSELDKLMDEKQGDKNFVESKATCYHNDGLYYAIDILEKTLGKVEGYQSDDGIMEHQTAIETVKALYHKKPAEWSEEDRKHIDNIISLLNQAKERFVRESGQFPSWITEILWLKSIKDRVQPQQQEWSEEGEKMLEDTISCLSAYQSPDISKGLCYQEQIDWLKSIKPNHWKPSEGQLEALKYVVDYFGELTEHFVEYEEIKSLYNDLKSL